MSLNIVQCPEDRFPFLAALLSHVVYWLRSLVPDIRLQLAKRLHRHSASKLQLTSTNMFLERQS